MDAGIRRALAILILALVAATMAYVWHPTRHISDEIGQPDLEKAFPQSFGDWRLDDRMPVVLPAPDVQAKLNAIYNQVLSRSYVSSAGDRIMLSVAYGGDQSDGTRAHRPEVCYPAQGFQIMFSDTKNLELGGTRALHVRHLVAKQGAREEPITYWVMVGTEMATGSTEQKIAQLRFGVRGLIPDGMLVRVSSIDSVPDRAFAIQQKFIGDLRSASSSAMRPRIFGF